MQKLTKNMAIGVSILASAAIVGCQGGSSASEPAPGMPPSHSSNGHHAYWTLLNGNPGTALEFASIPLAADTTPTSVAGSASNMLSFPNGVVFDGSDRLWIASYPASGPAPRILAVFKLPLTQASIPVLTFALPGTLGPFAITFDKSGNLWVADASANAVYEYAGPFAVSGTLTPSLTLTIGLTSPDGIAVDANGNVYVSNAAALNPIAVFKSPVFGGEAASFYLSGVVAPGALLFDSFGNLYTSHNPSVVGSQAAIVRYNGANLSSGATPNIVDSTSLNGITSGLFAMAIDSEGNLYVSDGAAMRIYRSVASSFSSSEAPSFIFTDPAISSCNCLEGIAAQ